MAQQALKATTQFKNTLVKASLTDGQSPYMSSDDVMKLPLPPKEDGKTVATTTRMQSMINNSHASEGMKSINVNFVTSDNTVATGSRPDSLFLQPDQVAAIASNQVQSELESMQLEVLRAKKEASEAQTAAANAQKEAANVKKELTIDLHQMQKELKESVTKNSNSMKDAVDTLTAKLDATDGRVAALESDQKVKEEEFNQMKRELKDKDKELKLLKQRFYTSQIEQKKQNAQNIKDTVKREMKDVDEDGRAFRAGYYRSSSDVTQINDDLRRQADRTDVLIRAESHRSHVELSILPEYVQEEVNDAIRTQLEILSDNGQTMTAEEADAIERHVREKYGYGYVAPN